MNLQVSKLSKSYADGERRLQILDHLSLELPLGKSLSIMGPSGCGKSTLISCLAGLLRPDEGQILLQGKDLTRLSPQELTRFRAQNIGVVFQQFHLVPYLNALENIRLPLDFQGLAKKEADDRGRQALEWVGLEKRGTHFPHKLSRGECQRVAIARVLVTSPQLILADEPTASLDRETGRDTLLLLIQLSQKQNAALIVVTHDESMASLCQIHSRFVGGKLKVLA